MNYLINVLIFLNFGENKLISLKFEYKKKKKNI